MQQYLLDDNFEVQLATIDLQQIHALESRCVNSQDKYALLKLVEIFKVNATKFNGLVASFNRDLDTVEHVDFIREIDNVMRLSSESHSHAPSKTQMSQTRVPFNLPRLDLQELNLYHEDKLNIFVNKSVCSACSSMTAQSIVILADDYDTSGQVFLKQLTTNGLELVMTGVFVVEMGIMRETFKIDYHTTLSKFLETDACLSKIMCIPVLLNELLRVQQQHCKQVLDDLFAKLNINNNHKDDLHLHNQVSATCKSLIDSMLSKLVECGSLLPA